ncbi:DoxX family protein [Nocardia sp. NPDC058658]|uniref:DoxX family protein n=1 Tax=Nocardia sp. NPDC058658 TaxID=3346580 RepID=UPI0036614847
MNYVATVVVGLLAIMVTGSALATLTRQKQIVDAVGAVGFPVQHLWTLGVVKLAAAIGLCLGLLWLPISVAAAVGLVVYFTAAVGMHVHAKQRDLAAPVVFLALSTAALVLLTSVGT